MSTPPVPPPVPNEPEPGSESGSQGPRYGQNAPQYGQNQPQYGQQSGTPQYGQNAPQYGQNPPQYGQSGAPQYGQNAPQYGQNPPAAPGYGQQPYGQSPYAQYPSEQPQPSGSTGVPQMVNISFWLLIASAAIFVISMLTGLTTLDDPMFRDAFETQIEGSGAGVTYEDMKGVIAGTLVVFAIIGLALYLLVAFFVRKGKNWARILGTVFAALSIFGLFGPPSFATLGTLLGIAAIVLLYLPASAPYFRRQQPFANPYGGNMGNPYGR
ncbi:MULTISPECIES: hypothetical protein [Pseudarthrobacter]|jgi:hypothetical protein|uniref:Uncharacterized protein n=1 Tax=Pseudarthrobacter oxydans TaxID=1671 RepID=A0AAW8NEP4_PSEOX|nr:MULTISPECIES: hypothetical protein [Pseudarthrobacter]MDR6793393.1 hypothetical protein [Pseudarthrobacter oxydans]MDR7164528.1 hypothetical protein [Pseudarthrobacter oxydans]NSX36718.1 hypothetical protein [Pseudarthrobacter oxydans]GKV74433.1 hypothetical protein NCCP2145_38140 [Pseudarthrobacter sp. NCCP-2145]